MKTYSTLYEGDIKALQIVIRDQDDRPWNPSYAETEIVSAGTIVDSARRCLIRNNAISQFINGIVTNNPGTYEIIWKLNKYVILDRKLKKYTYYHKTELIIEEK